MGSADKREALEIRISVLATESQALALQAVIGEAICQAPLDHSGPCRIAWDVYVESEISRSGRKEIWDQLGPVETWSDSDVNQSLGITPAAD